MALILVRVSITAAELVHASNVAARTFFAPAVGSGRDTGRAMSQDNVDGKIYRGHEGRPTASGTAR